MKRYNYPRKGLPTTPSYGWYIVLTGVVDALVSTRLSIEASGIQV